MVGEITKILEKDEVKKQKEVVTVTADKELISGILVFPAVVRGMLQQAVSIYDSGSRATAFAELGALMEECDRVLGWQNDSEDLKKLRAYGFDTMEKTIKDNIQRAEQKWEEVFKAKEKEVKKGYA